MALGKTILRVTVGSTLYGTSLSGAQGDLDLMSVVIESPLLRLGFQNESTWVERTKPEGARSMAGDTDHTMYGLSKYVKLALRGNPSILVALFVEESPLLLLCTEEGKSLQCLYHKIISKQAYAAYDGYMHQQMERMAATRGKSGSSRPELIEKHGYDTKYAGHVLRLGFQGCELLRSGRLKFPMAEEERRLVLEVRNGAHSFEEVMRISYILKEEMRACLSSSKLPEHPDTEAVEKWVVDTYLAYWRQLR